MTVTIEKVRQLRDSAQQDVEKLNETIRILANRKRPGRKPQARKENP